MNLVRLNNCDLCMKPIAWDRDLCHECRDECERVFTPEVEEEIRKIGQIAYLEATFGELSHG